jgi:hypothetical protein
MSTTVVNDIAASKVIKIQARGERTFSLTFTSREVQDIFDEWFIRNFHAQIGNMNIQTDYENDGSMTVSGHEEIKEG